MSQEVDLIRPVVSLDWDDIASFVVAFSALVAVFIGKRTTNTNKELTETVDSDVLSRFEELFSRITMLEKDLAAAKIGLDTAQQEIKELHKLEEYLQAKLHEKDAQVAKLTTQRIKNEAEIKSLRASLVTANERIRHLEKILER